MQGDNPPMKKGLEENKKVPTDLVETLLVRIVINQNFYN